MTAGSPWRLETPSFWQVFNRCDSTVLCSTTRVIWPPGFRSPELQVPGAEGQSLSPSPAGPADGRGGPPEQPAAAESSSLPSPRRPAPTQTVSGDYLGPLTVDAGVDDRKGVL